MTCIARTALALLTARCVVCLFACCVRVQAWVTGRNYYGQLGLGDTTDRSTPEQLPSPTNIVQVAAGVEHTVMLAHA